MTTARDVIAEAMPARPKYWIDNRGKLCTKIPSLAEIRQEADVVLSALHSAGYVIIKDRTDPEGGIPGRQI